MNGYERWVNEGNFRLRFFVYHRVTEIFKTMANTWITNLPRLTSKYMGVLETR